MNTMIHVCCRAAVAGAGICAGAFAPAALAQTGRPASNPCATGTVYDSRQGLCWLADANLAGEPNFVTLFGVTSRWTLAEKPSGCWSDPQCRCRTTPIRTAGAGPLRSTEDSRKESDEEVQTASGDQTEGSVSGPDPEIAESSVTARENFLIQLGFSHLPPTSTRPQPVPHPPREDNGM